MLWVQCPRCQSYHNIEDAEGEAPRRCLGCGQDFQFATAVPVSPTEQLVVPEIPIAEARPSLPPVLPIKEGSEAAANDEDVPPGRPGRKQRRGRSGRFREPASSGDSAGQRPHLHETRWIYGFLLAVGAVGVFDILAGKIFPPSHGQINWTKVLWAAVIGGVFGGLGALFGKWIESPRHGANTRPEAMPLSSRAPHRDRERAWSVYGQVLVVSGCVSFLLALLLALFSFFTAVPLWISLLLFSVSAAAFVLAFIELAKPFWLVVFCGLSFLATFGVLMLNEYKPAPNPAPVKIAGSGSNPRVPPARQVPLPPLKEPFERGPRVYLSDLEEFAVKAGPWPFAKNGHVGNDQDMIVVNGEPSPKGLGMHPPDMGDSSARYRVGKKAALFKAAVAINDTSPFNHQPAVFEVWGDGRRLWQSSPVSVRKPPQPQDCRVDVTGVDVLELRVHAQGSHFGLHAVWIEPRLLQKADTPDD